MDGALVGNGDGQQQQQPQRYRRQDLMRASAEEGAAETTAAGSCQAAERRHAGIGRSKSFGGRPAPARPSKRKRKPDAQERLFADVGAVLGVPASATDFELTHPLLMQLALQPDLYQEGQEDFNKRIKLCGTLSQDDDKFLSRLLPSCNCRRTHRKTRCQKTNCACFKAGLACGILCSCKSCCNTAYDRVAVYAARAVVEARCPDTFLLTNMTVQAGQSNMHAEAAGNAGDVGAEGPLPAPEDEAAADGPAELQKANADSHADVIDCSTQPRSGLPVAPADLAATQRTLAGLPNVGNSCYMSAVLQAVLRLPSFSSDLSKTSKTCKGLVSEALREITLRMMVADRNPLQQSSLCGSILQLKEALGSRFADHAQEDAAEFLVALLQRVHAEHFKAHPRKGLRVPISTISDPAMRNLSWSEQLLYRCSGCGAITTKVEQHLMLHLNMLPTNRSTDTSAASIGSLMASSFKVETVRKACTPCQQELVVHTLSRSIKRPPRIFACLLKRWEVHGGPGGFICNKITGPVSAELELELTQLMAEQSYQPLSHSPAVPNSGNKENLPGAANQAQPLPRASLGSPTTSEQPEYDQMDPREAAVLQQVLGLSRVHNYAGTTPVTWRTRAPGASYTAGSFGSSSVATSQNLGVQHAIEQSLAANAAAQPSAMQASAASKEAQSAPAEQEASIAVEVAEDSGLESCASGCKVRYRLRAAVLHVGNNPRAGHYTARVWEHEQWWHCDDDCVDAVSAVLTHDEQRAVCMVLYELMDDGA